MPRRVVMFTPDPVAPAVAQALAIVSEFLGVHQIDATPAPTLHPRSVLHADFIKTIAAHYRTCHRFDRARSVYPLLRQYKRSLMHASQVHPH